MSVRPEVLHPDDTEQPPAEGQESSRAGLESIFSGTSEMATLMRAFDWSTTEVGDPEKWPESLKAAVRICVGSRNPIVIWWGRKALTQIYNDGYMRILTAAKHPKWLGRSGAECWTEIMDTMGPMWEQVLATGEATWYEDFLYVMNRNLPREECYFTFSYSALRDDAGKIDGILCICYETTNRVVGDRRLQTLRDLGRTVSVARTAEEACKSTADILAANPGDIPFALLYLLDEKGREARLVATSGFGDGNPAAPERIDVLSTDESAWPLRRVLENGSVQRVDELSARFGELPGGTWPESPESALVVPIVSGGQFRGFLVAGLSPRRIVDADYLSFFDLIAGHVGTAIGNATAYEQERRRAEALAEIDRAKTAFFTNISHEFRTPLTLMLGPIEEVLGAQDLSPSVRQELQLAQRNSLRLLKLVNTLLDFSRIEAGRMQAVYEPVEIASYTADLASLFRSAVEAAGMKLVIDCRPPKQPVYIDREMWEKIVLNLLSNAFKFTLAGEIKVTLKQAGGMVELAVEDTGTGIPAADLPHVFERFHRVTGARGRSMEGSGIGLALVRELAKLHGGDVRVQSEMDRGSTFTVTIPLGSAHLPADRLEGARSLASTRLGGEHYVEEALRWLPDMQDANLAAAGSGEVAADFKRVAAKEPIARVLVADDNADMREYIRRLLRGGYEVEAVSDGLQALCAAREHRPDLVLADVMMPKLDGFELVKQLRADEGLKTVPIILLSARAGEEAKAEGLDSGADDYLIKPFSARELSARVDAQLKMARLRDEAAKRAMEERISRQTMLAAELQHRVRNILAMIRALTTRTAESATNVEEYGELLSGRILSLARTQAMLTRTVNGNVRLGSLIREELGAHAQQLGDYSVDGPEAMVSAKAAEVLSLAIHELATNALKYGAFSEPGGRVSVRWAHAQRDGVRWLSFRWSEHRVQPMQRSATARRGFGTEMIERRIPYELQGFGKLSLDEWGAQCEIEFPLREGGSVLETELPPRVAVSNVSNGAKSCGGLQDLSIFIAEDDFYTADGLERVLRESGARIDGLFSQEDSALDWLRSHAPDAALVDINLGSGPSFRIARALRAKGIPLIFVTGYEQSMIPAEFADVVRLQKPIDLEGFAEMVAELVGSGQPAREPSAR